MFKLLLKLLVLPPELLHMHAQGYADLASQSWAERLCTLKNRWALFALSAVSLVLALIWAGVALLLWSALPPTDARHAWLLPTLPAVMLVIAVALWALGRRMRTRPVLQDIQEQLQLDLLAIQATRAA
jgi:ABC-type nickel/cobalt efflux system permease component RcnA